MMRTIPAKFVAVRGCREWPSLVDAADNSATASEMASGISSRRAGLMRCTLSLFGAFLAVSFFVIT
jgi:hypothetical protein